MKAITCCLIVISIFLQCRGFIVSHTTSKNVRSTDILLAAKTDDNGDNMEKSDVVRVESSRQEASASSLDRAAILRQQVEKLQAEVQSLQRVQNETRKEKFVQKRVRTESWIDELLVNITIGDSTEILNTVEEVARVLVERRYSPEQIDLVFSRLIEEHNWNSPMLELLADAANKVDVIERENNPNKRWNQEVERRLRHKLFAMKYGLNPDLYD